MLANIKVYDFDEAVVASGYPMKTAVDESIPPVSNRDTKRAELLSSFASVEGHDNFLAGILVSFDLTCSIKMWTEFERYHFAQIVSSQSTMHRLDSFELDSVFNAYTDDVMINRLKELQETYKRTKDREDFMRLLYSCPVGLKLTARVTTNYRQLKTIYHQRYNHRLTEWRDFCDELLSLPHFKEMCT